MTTAQPSAPTPPLPDAVHDQVEWETAVAFDLGFQHGYQAALADVAARHTELDDTWKPIGRLALDQQIARRIADMETAAARFQELAERRHGRGHNPSCSWPPIARPGGRATAA